MSLLRRLAPVATAIAVAVAVLAITVGIAWVATTPVTAPQPGSAQAVTVWLGQHDLACNGWVHTVPMPGQVDAGMCTTAQSHSTVDIAVWAGTAPGDVPLPDGWEQVSCGTWTAASLDLRWLGWVTVACEGGDGRG